MNSSTECARMICLAFQEHDRGNLEEAGILFGRLYHRLFQGVSEADATQAGREFANALAIKDEIDADQDRTARLVDPRWSEVYAAFRRKAELLNIDPRWAYYYNEFWRKHKGEIDYWNDLIESERFYSQRLVGAEWSDKRSDGRNGPGPLPLLYAVAVEAHDLHTESAWKMAEVVMAEYYRVVLEAQARLAPTPQLAQPKETNAAASAAAC